MQTDPWSNRFVDGGDVEISIDIMGARVDMTVESEKDMQFYHLVFGSCVSIHMDYSTEGQDDDERDVYNLTEGVIALPSTRARYRFLIHFMDDSSLDISCNSVEMEPIDVPQYARDVRSE